MKNKEFKEVSGITREDAEKLLNDKEIVQYLEKRFPVLQENEILIIKGSESGSGKTFFIKEVQNQEWLSAYLEKGILRSKEFYTLNV